MTTEFTCQVGTNVQDVVNGLVQPKRVEIRREIRSIIAASDELATAVARLQSEIKTRMDAHVKEEAQQELLQHCRRSLSAGIADCILGYNYTAGSGAAIKVSASWRTSIDLEIAPPADVRALEADMQKLLQQRDELKARRKDCDRRALEVEEAAEAISGALSLGMIRRDTKTLELVESTLGVDVAAFITENARLLTA